MTTKKVVFTERHRQMFLEQIGKLKNIQWLFELYGEELKKLLDETEQHLCKNEPIDMQAVGTISGLTLTLNLDNGE